MSPRYEHLYDISFSLRSNDEKGGYTAEQIRQAIYRRVGNLDDSELFEAIGAPFEVTDLEEEEAVGA